MLNPATVKDNFLAKIGSLQNPDASEAQKQLLEDLALKLEGETSDARDSIQQRPPVRSLKDYAERLGIESENLSRGFDQGVIRRGSMLEQSTNAEKARADNSTNNQLRSIGALTQAAQTLQEPQYEFANKSLGIRDSNIAAQNEFTANRDSKYYEFAGKQATKDLMGRLGLGALVMLLG